MGRDEALEQVDARAARTEPGPWDRSASASCRLEDRLHGGTATALNVDLELQRDYPPLDLALVQGLRDLGGKALLTEILQLFRDDLARHLPELGEFLGACDSVRLGNAAHALRGSSASLGAIRLAAAAEVLEQLAESGELEQAGSVIAELDVRAVQALAALDLQAGGS